MSESKSPKLIIKTSVVKFLEHLQQQKDSLENEISYLLEELRLNSVHIQSAKAGGTYSISEVNQIVKTINTTMSDYFKKTYTSISVDASRRMRLVLEDLLRLVGGALGEADITEIIQKIESFESQMLIAEEMTEKFTSLEKLMKERETEIEKLHELVKSERLKKEDLEKESIEKVKKIEDLANEITRLEGELKSCVEQIESGGMVPDLNIEELETTIREGEKRIVELENVIGEREKEIEELKTRIEELDLSEKNDAEALIIKLQEKEHELKYLQIQLQEIDVEIKTIPRPKPTTNFDIKWFPCMLMTKRKHGSR